MKSETILDPLVRPACDRLERAFVIRDRLYDLLNSNPASDEAAVLMSDFIRHARGALDRAVWGITPQRIRNGAPADVAFPLHPNERRYLEWAEMREQWYGPRVFEALRAVQPFVVATPATRHPLGVLEYLSNVDSGELAGITAHGRLDRDGGDRAIALDDAIDAIGPCIVAAVGYVSTAHAQDVSVRLN